MLDESVGQSDLQHRQRDALGGEQLQDRAPRATGHHVFLDRYQPLVALGQAHDQLLVERLGHEIGALDTGECFGETSYVRGAKRLATIRAAGDVTVMKVSSTLLEQVSAACQLRFNKAFLRSLITRLQTGEG